VRVLRGVGPDPRAVRIIDALNDVEADNTSSPVLPLLGHNRNTPSVAVQLGRRDSVTQKEGEDVTIRRRNLLLRPEPPYPPTPTEAMGIIHGPTLHERQKTAGRPSRGTKLAIGDGCNVLHLVGNDGTMQSTPGAGKSHVLIVVFGVEMADG